MTFFVEKRLALGHIRFGVSRRRAIDAIDDNPQLSTGGAGEFIRRRSEGFYFGGQDRFDTPVLPEVSSIRSTPFWISLSQRRGVAAVAVIGALLVVLGFGVLATKGAQGLLEIIVGGAMISASLFLTAQERKKIRDQEERARAERGETERRNREMLTSYSAALERIQNDHSEDAMQQLVNEHPDLPYRVWSASARRTVLLIGFDQLARHGVAGANDVARVMDRAGRAAGLTPEDQMEAKLDLYRAVLWHLLADDRLGSVQQEQLAELRKGLGIDDRYVSEETKIADQFEQLRGITTLNLPRQQCTTQLVFNEHCIHQTNADDGLLHVTNRNLIVERKKRHVHANGALSDITVTPDERMVRVRDGTLHQELSFRVEDPIYVAAMIDLATSIDERPRGFA